MSLKSFLFTNQKTYPPIEDIMIISIGIVVSIFFNGTIIIYGGILAITIAFANLTLDMFKYKHHLDTSSNKSTPGESSK